MTPRPISEVARDCGFAADEIIPYGHDKAKVSLSAINRTEGTPQGKLIVVTAISPTPAGEGKTVTSIGLGDGLRRLGAKTAICLREPSLGPVFGMKGGGAGGGKAQAYPAVDLNLHFTGDFHAIGAAHNLLSALVEAHIHHGNERRFQAHSVLWNRVLDVTDRSLRQCVIGLGGKSNGTPRETGFDITAASEIMALVSLSSSYADLKRRLGGIVVGVDADGSPIQARDLQAEGALAVLLRDALLPNLIQTLEGTPLFIHTGPFGNLATGCNSILADRLALGAADYVVTECGFGSDLGFEKFCHIVSPQLGKVPDIAVIVATVRALKSHSGRFKLVPGKPLPDSLSEENVEAVREGAVNLKAHIANVRGFGVPVVVAINRFPTDSLAELCLVDELARQWGADDVAVSNAFICGGEGSAQLATAVRKVVDSMPAQFEPLYQPAQSSLFDKIETIARRVYGAEHVDYGPGTQTALRRFEKWGWGHLPVCFAKTQYSFSHDPKLLGAPSGFALSVSQVQLAAGAGFVRVLCGEIMTMPGLPAVPAAFRMDLDDEGRITGVM